MNAADKTQASLHKRFSPSHFLGDQKRCLLFMDWITFFRRNLEKFAETYLSIPLYLYQKIIMHLLGVNDSFVLVAARAAAKSFLIALYSCCKAILYPNSIIVIASATKGQSRLIVEEKIRRELMPKSKALCMEIDSIKNNQNETIVYFKNNSRITVVPASDNARGHRSTIMCYEEFRMIPKRTADEVLSPFAVTRDRPYMTKPEYAGEPSLKEESKEVYISSAWFRSHWMWGHMLSAMKDMFAGKPSVLMPLDYSLALKHGIKTRAQLVRDKKKFDPVTWAIEYENVMMRENTGAFFTFDMLSRRQILKTAFYPRRFPGAKARGIPKLPGEIRIISCDIAMIDRRENDNSVNVCLRLIPESRADGERTHTEYHIQTAYIEHSRGGETLKQATRIKQLFADFDADFCVLDGRAVGIPVYDALAKPIYDEQRGVEYRPWVCMNNEDYAKRIVNPDALRVLYVFTASSRRNSEMAVNVRSMITGGKIDFLIPHGDAAEEVLPQITEYAEAFCAEDQLFFENPYLETTALINEMASLQCERLEGTGIIRLSERPSEMKDRYVALAMGCYFAAELERDELYADDLDVSEGTCVSYLE